MGESGARSKSPRSVDEALAVVGSETRVREGYRGAKENEANRNGRWGVGTFRSTEEAGESEPKETLWRKGNVVRWNR